jgi:hypothetical protein
MKKKHVMMVLTRCKPGTDAEFNDWYDRIHIPDLLTIPDVVGAQRFKLAETQRVESRPEHNYLSVYELETDNLPATYKDMGERIAGFAKTDTLERPTWVYVYSAIGERKTKQKPR